MSSTITLVKDPASLLRGAEHLLVVAPQRTFSPRSGGRKALARLLGEELAELAVDLSGEASPGLLGKTASSRATAKVRRLTVGVLPDTGSRYNSPARAEAIRTVVRASSVADSARGAILILLDEAEHLVAAANAVGRATPLLSLKSGKKEKAKKLSVLCADPRGTAIAPGNLAKEVLHAARETARLVDTPPTDLDPAALAKEAKALLRGLPGVKVKEITGDALLAAGLRGIHAVGRCAKAAPRVLVASYRPTGAKGKHVALVGKGITYDTGGLHLKARGMMETMKGDMGGSAAVLGAFRVLVRTGFKSPLTLVMCMAENAIGPAAYKPDDVLTMHSGKTVEINNTDAEGRLLLADGVSYAARVLKADVVLDAATLTGAQLVATGILHAAVFSNDEEVERALVEAGTQSGDLTHPLPFAPEFYKSEFKSPLADMRNSVKNRSNAQSSCAAQFIYWHVEDTDVRWGHVDLAGPAFRDDRGTGFGVALLAEAARRLR